VCIPRIRLLRRGCLGLTLVLRSSYPCAVACTPSPLSPPPSSDAPTVSRYRSNIHLTTITHLSIPGGTSSLADRMAATRVVRQRPSPSSSPSPSPPGEGGVVGGGKCSAGIPQSCRTRLMRDREYDTRGTTEVVEVAAQGVLRFVCPKGQWRSGQRATGHPLLHAASSTCAVSFEPVGLCCIRTVEVIRPYMSG
jgi:hypothetical protein